MVMTEQLPNESRATVPDAATKKLREASGADRIRLGHLQDEVYRLEAERDAALAAVERVRLVVDNHRSVEQHNEMVPMSDIADLIREPSSADYLSALDVAPEPEVKP